jgi:preprotein translocase subunit SecA
MLSTLSNFISSWRNPFVALQPRTEPWTLQHPAIAAWHARADEIRASSDEQLKVLTAELKQKIAANQIERLAAQIQAGALAGEAVRRTVGYDLFDTQRLAGLVLAQGMIAQMQTGEGKTLTGAAPILYAALQGRGVHVMMPNQYLAERDAQSLKPAFQILGISSGLLKEKDDDAARQRAYRCDVTYGAGYEFGFDYLRDQIAQINTSRTLGAEFSLTMRGLKRDSGNRQRGLAWAIIDEADSILLDEATVPMLLSGPPDGKKQDHRPFHIAQQCAEKLRANIDFEYNTTHSRLKLTEVGTAKVASALAPLGPVELFKPWSEYVEKALLANYIYLRDVHYVVQGEKVVIVDESTGRLYADRSWRDGLHQAVETKERLPLSGSNVTQGQISRQRFLRQYSVICGMTGTIEGSEPELKEAYGLSTVCIPTRLPPKRKKLPDRFFTDRDSKWKAAVDSIIEVHKTGRPILVGSRTIQASEAIAQFLTQHGINCTVLNGKQSADEAALVATAGQQGAVMVATNMAGRGTDIKLGAGVRELGGLHMVGLERNTSARADGQLAGRVARQGDPGTFQFFVAADDNLLTKFAPRAAREMARMPHHQGELSGDLSRYVDRAQQAAEAEGRLQRQRVRGQDDSLGETTSRLYGVK